MISSTGSRFRFRIAAISVQSTQPEVDIVRGAILLEIESAPLSDFRFSGADVGSEQRDVGTSPAVGARAGALHRRTGRQLAVDLRAVATASQRKPTTTASDRCCRDSACVAVRSFRSARYTSGSSASPCPTWPARRDRRALRTSADRKCHLLPAALTEPEVQIHFQ